MSPVHTPVRQSLVSTLIPMPHDTLQLPSFHSPYWTQGGISHGLVLIKSSMQFPWMQTLVSTLIPLPHSTLQVPISQSLTIEQTSIWQSIDLTRASVHTP